MTPRDRAPLIAVVDHGAGNLVSIAQGLEAAGAKVGIATQPNDLDSVAGVVVPGVGHTGAAMHGLRRAGLVEPLSEVEVPLLGICVGLQLFFEMSAEDGGACLGWIEGTVQRLQDTPRLPHIGWNNLRFSRHEPLFEGIAVDAPFYFVHSYAPVPVDRATVVATTQYGSEIVAAVRSANRVGVQFHPERSGPEGLRVLANFLASCTETTHVA